MGRFASGRVYGWGLLLATAALAGCTSMDLAVARIKGEATTDVVPGVESPAERLAALETIREKAGWADSAEKEQIAAQLVAAYDEGSDPMIRAAIVRAATGYQMAGAADMMHRALGDPDASVRAAACEALGRRGDAEAVRLLSGALASDVDSDVRLAAVAALGQTGDRGAISALGEALEDADPAMQYRAVQALQRITGENLGNDANQWRMYVRGEIPPSDPPVSIVERFRRMF